MKSLTLNMPEKLPYGAEEALSRLRINIGFCGDRFKKIMVSSSTPDEGKSFVTANLWRVLAETGKKVILVDADIRKSVLRSRYSIKADGSFWGLPHYLAGNATLNDVVYSTNFKNAYMLPAANTVSNPAILFQGERFSELLDTLAETFDYVLVDTPPMSNVSDGDLIASKCDGAILVVRSGVTSRRLVASSLKQLERANCELMGMVLNRVETKKSAYYYKYSKYGYGYGQNTAKGILKRSK